MSRVKHLRAGRLGCATSVQKKSSTENQEKTSQTERIPAIYCPGDSAGVSSVPAGDSIVAAAGASVAAGLVSVVAGAVVGAGVAAGVTVSVFLFTSREKRGTGQNADVFLHSWRRILL